MTSNEWTFGNLTYVDRLPPLPADSLDEKQRAVANELAAGPRGGVKGPFIPLLRSPELVDRIGKLGEYVRFGSSLEARISEFVMLLVSREWTNQFEWAMHVPLALKNGSSPEVIQAIAEGRYPDNMTGPESTAYAVCSELSRNRGVSDTTFNRAVACFGERGVIDLIAVFGYFSMVCAFMNAAHTPPATGTDGPRLMPFPP